MQRRAGDFPVRLLIQVIVRSVVRRISCVFSRSRRRIQGLSRFARLCLVLRRAYVDKRQHSTNNAGNASRDACPLLSVDNTECSQSYTGQGDKAVHDFADGCPLLSCQSHVNSYRSRLLYPQHGRAVSVCAGCRHVVRLYLSLARTGRPSCG
nr:MAG TPA: hypothetical protein [Caudoviricetes sp.]